jgi:hypothetical protein
MKYKKGTFVVIPNKQHLKGKPSEMQSIYFWLCEHSNDTGGCFPTKETIGEDAGCSHNTVDKYLKQLVDEGFLKITKRRKKGTMSFTSNYYQVLIISQEPKVVPPTPISGNTGGTNTGSKTNLSINSNNLITAPTEVGVSVSKEFEVPYSYVVELNALGESKKVIDKIIYNFFVKKNFNFENHKQFVAEYKKNLRPASALSGYSSQQINKTMDYCEQNYSNFGWSLATVVKRISELVNK